MAVVVVPSNETSPSLTFTDAASWHIDELTLHVRGTSGNVASFGPHQWAAVYDNESVTQR